MIPGGLALTFGKGAEGPCPRPPGTLHLFCVRRHYHARRSSERLFPRSRLRLLSPRPHRLMHNAGVDQGDAELRVIHRWQVGLGTATAISQSAGVADRPFYAPSGQVEPAGGSPPWIRQARHYPSALPKPTRVDSTARAKLCGPVLPGQPRHACVICAGGRRSQSCGRLRSTAQAGGNPPAGTAALRTSEQAGGCSPRLESTRSARLGQHLRRAVAHLPATGASMDLPMRSNVSPNG